MNGESAGASGASGASAPGSLVAEAALLAAAVRDWMSADGAGRCDHGVPGAGGSADGERAAPSSAATPSTCQICPVCRLIAAVTASRPEATVHLVTAVAALTEAYRVVREAWAAGAPASEPPAAAESQAEPSSECSPQSSSASRPRAGSTNSRPRVQRIDVR